jgi:anaerobic glycerol-3-phosphate dehydrogenase
MRTSFDVLVIGGGIAGIGAALRSHAEGASVAVVRAGPGASAVTGGGWSGPLDPVLGKALSRAGLPYVPAVHALPHPFGELRRYDFAAEPHVAPWGVDSALLCGIAGLGAFAVPSLARLYATSADRSVPFVTALAQATPAAGWSPMALAAQLERDPHIFDVPVRAAITPAVTHVLMPAVLGIDNHAAVRAAMSESFGVPVYECLGAPPSIPGLRLDRALLRALEHARIEIVTGLVHGCDATQNRISRVHVSVDGVTRTLTADRYVLATGKFLGGGLATISVTAREHALVETALGLPVWIDHLNQSFSNAESLTLTSRVRTYDQPLLRAGVHTDAASRAVDARGRTVYANLAVAGTVRSDVDASAGLGHASTEVMAHG